MNYATQMPNKSAANTGWMKTIFAISFWFCAAPAVLAQAKPAQSKSTDPDKLGLPCIQILQKSSQDWVAYFDEKTASAKTNGSSGTLRAIATYAMCFDARTTFLAATLGKSGKGPLLGATGNFRDFQAALDNFTAKALTAVNKQPGSSEAAYAGLYEKQFRYEFYRNYAHKNFAISPAHGRSIRRIQQSQEPFWRAPRIATRRNGAHRSRCVQPDLFRWCPSMR